MHGLLGLKHLILMGISLVFIIVGILVARKWRLEKMTKVLLGIGLASELIKIFYFIITNEAELGGVLPKTDLPLHLCSIQLIFLTFLVYSKNEKLKDLIISFMIPSCLFGGLAAILIATTSSLNGLWILSLQYFGYHASIVVFSLVLLISNTIKLTVKHYFGCLKFVVLLMMFAIYVNSIIYDGTSDINFMYVVSPPQPGLPFLNEDYGWVVYMAHYASLVVLCVTLCYIRPIVQAIRGKKADKITV